MSANAWMTSDNLLMDLRLVNGRNPGAEHLEHYLVRGEGPPPVRPEMTDDDEIQYRFYAAPGTSADDDNTPDLRGIAQMLQMVNNCDDDGPGDSDEFKTIIRNTASDEICISKLNPRVEEFVPGQNITGLNRTKTLEHQTNVNKKGPVLIKRSDKTNKSGGQIDENVHSSSSSSVSSKMGKKENNEISLGITGNVASSSISNLPVGQIFKEPVSHCSTSSVSSSRALDVGDISLCKKLDIDNMKIDDIIAVDEKVKSKIISSSKDNSLQSRKEKNVAIATLLKLRSAQKVPTETTVKLFTPDFFQVPPTPVDDVEKLTTKDLDDVNKEVTQIDESPSTSTQNQYVDPLVRESICKVNDWFNSAGKPKQKPQIFASAKQSMTIKKKTTPNPSTRSTPSIEKKESCADFIPSSYANDLLQKYETNARKKVAPKEDLGTMLERQLKERDQQIKKKLLESKQTVSPGSGRSVQ